MSREASIKKLLHFINSDSPNFLPVSEFMDTNPSETALYALQKFSSMVLESRGNEIGGKSVAGMLQCAIVAGLLCGNAAGLPDFDATIDELLESWKRTRGENVASIGGARG